MNRYEGLNKDILYYLYNIKIEELDKLFNINIFNNKFHNFISNNESFMKHNKITDFFNIKNNFMIGNYRNNDGVLFNILKCHKCNLNIGFFRNKNINFSEFCFNLNDEDFLNFSSIYYSLYEMNNYILNCNEYIIKNLIE